MNRSLSKIEQLITEFCPEGVEYKELGILGDFYGGLSGKNKNDFSNGNAKFVTYMNIFSNIAVNTDTNTLVNVGEGENQHKVEYGDVLFTGSSETPDECGMSSVLTKKLEEPLYLNSFCFGFRLYEKDVFLAEFLKYLFRGEQVRKQIAKTASGVTRFNVSKKRFAKILIPIPPIPIQQEIAKILDSFTELEAELEAELESRKKQYKYYRDELLDIENVEYKSLGEIGSLTRGSGLPKTDFTETGIGCIHYGQIYTYYGVFTDKTKSFVSKQTAEKLKKVKKGDLIVTSTSENIEDVCKAVAWLGEDDIVTGGHATILRHSENPKYLSYYLQTRNFADQKRKYAKGTKVIDVSAKDLAKIKIPLPTISEQNRIVSILDKFDALVNDISIGLPAELKARHQQYDYYRNKLLTFKEYGK